MRSALLFLAMIVCGVGCRVQAPSAEFVEQARRLHEQVLASAVAGNGDLRDYLQLVGGRLAEAARVVEPERTRDPLFSRMRFDPVACAVPNVFTTGGAHIYICNGLIQTCRTEDELAAAIAHAYAHAVNLDVERIGIEPRDNEPIAELCRQFVTHRFSLDQEHAADRLGFELYVRAGYDPAAFATLCTHLADLYPSEQSSDRTPLLVRAEQARQRSLQVPPARRPLPVADPRTFVSLKRRAANLDPRSATPAAQLFLEAFPNCMLSGDTPEQRAAQERLRPPPERQLEPN